MRLLYSEEFNPGDLSILPGLSFDKFSQWAAILSQRAEMPQQDGRVKLVLAATPTNPFAFPPPAR
jgi:hypothetical protein